MGKTKLKTIDDSVKEEVSKKPKKKAEKPNVTEDVQVLETEARGDSEEGSRRMTAATPSLSRGSEDVRRDTELAGPRASPIQFGKNLNAQSLSERYLE